MCGIAGIWGSVEDGHLTNMMGLQRHRGPDGKGTSLHALLQQIQLNKSGY